MILDFMLHDIDYISWLLGNPLRVASRGLPCKQGGWDNVFIDLVYEDALVVIEGSCILPMSAPFQTSLRLVCSRGALDIDWAMTGNEPETMMLLYKEQGTPETVTVPGQDPYRAECLHLFECLEHGEASPLMDVSQAYRSLKIALAAREALRRGTSSAF